MAHLHRFLGLLLVLLLMANAVQAQDAHYWTNQYGTRAQLLGGIVVGSLKDLSSSYYNPAAIALSADSSVLFATDALEFNFITFDEAAGNNLDLRSKQARTPPSMAAFRIPVKAIPRHQFVGSVLTRHNFNFSGTNYRIEDQNPTFADAGGIYFSGELQGKQTMRDDWYGITWAYRRSERMAIGITQYLAARAQSGDWRVATHFVSQTDSSQSSLIVDKFDYYTLRFLWKLGLTYRASPQLTWGVALTTPSLHLFGEGATFINITAIREEQGGLVYQLASNRQKSLRAIYKSPLSLAVGVSYKMGRTEVHSSAEWFGRVASYTVLDAKDFTSQTSGDTLVAQIDHELRSIINFGIGLQHTMSERVVVYGSAILDQSATTPELKTPLAISTWDIVHLTLGSAFKVRNVDLTLGFGYSFGGNRYVPFLRFPSSDEAFDSGALTGEAQDVTYQRFRILLGISIGV